MAKPVQTTRKANGGAKRPEDVIRLAIDAFLAEQQKALAIQVDDLTMAMKAASGSLEQTGHESAANLTAAAAEGVGRWSSDMLKLDANDLLCKVQEGSERYPWLYLGGAAIAGAALAHYLNRAGHAGSGD
ncbi:hypothetical protein [Pseudokordiimonas caeni]|uniref:hypothetical protein n=1 Tax=Pseudokordiimonas caeni TaxID=2997908 RepID=UPI00281224E7|nr:hypothetical protein [Pseudokordiimonas caeni]